MAPRFVRRMLFLGNDSSSLILPGNRSINNGAGGSFSGYVTMRSALADDGVARNFTTNTTLKRTHASSGSRCFNWRYDCWRGSTRGHEYGSHFQWLAQLIWRHGADGISWNTFMADQSNGYRASTGVQNSWGITGGGGGFAARNGNLNILIDANQVTAMARLQQEQCSTAISQSALLLATLITHFMQQAMSPSVKHGTHGNTYHYYCSDWVWLDFGCTTKPTIQSNTSQLQDFW